MGGSAALRASLRSRLFTFTYLFMVVMRTNLRSSAQQFFLAGSEIVHAVKDIIASGVKADDVTEQMISERLYTSGQPDPDFIIRPSGEYRLSNYLIWQSAYAEFWFSDILWPDFTSDDLDKAIIDYGKRNRRFGGV